MDIALAIIVALVVAALALAFWRVLDGRADRAEWARLARLQPAHPDSFDTGMVADLPEPARRYFGYAIRPGTPLLRVVEIDMRGQFSLGTRAAPNYQPMEARQILAAPEGFVWAMHTKGGLPISGSDTGRWTRFRIMGLIPVARIGGDPDHARSAFGRYVGEAAIWSPAALLPGPGVVWEEAGKDSARVTVTRGGLSQTVEIRLDPEGRPVEAVFQRWSNANPDKEYREQPFGAVMSDFREVGGFRLPFRVEAGNLFGTAEYFPFFIAELTAIRFPEAVQR